MKKQKLLLSLVMLSALMTLCLGCASSKTINVKAIKNPVFGKDYYVDDKGSYCMSPAYTEQILKLKIEQLVP